MLLLFCRGRSSSSLKLLSWLGSKSSSAAMLSIKRLTAPLEGCKKIDVHFYLGLSLNGFEIQMFVIFDPHTRLPHQIINQKF